MIKFRKYQEGDKEQIIKLISKILFEIFNYTPNSLQDLKNIKEYYFKNKGIFYVAEENKKIIGTLGVRRESEGIARLGRMYVTEEYRRRGIGQILLNIVLRFCKKEGYKEIILSTHPPMKAAIEFYKKNGFKEYERNEQILFKKIL
jgi:ribosomal protein S18 acetylase RimI-like enzyme